MPPGTGKRDRPRRDRLAGFMLKALVLTSLGVGSPLLIRSGATQARNPGPAAGQDPFRSPAIEGSIRAVLNDQTAAWNRGDLDGFLTGYWRSPLVVFQSGGTRHDGFDAMRDRYRQRYQADGKAMGQLTFTALEVEPLGLEAAFARGRYTLTMPDGTHPTGLFTLIVRKFADGWKITHDHTSAAEPAAPQPGPAPAQAPSPRPSTAS